MRGPTSSDRLPAPGIAPRLANKLKLSEAEVDRRGIHALQPDWCDTKKLGKWRLTVDLSFPESASVNDGISSLMGKMDIKQAYRMVPVDVARAAQKVGL